MLEWELDDAAAEVECVRRRRRLSLGGRSGHVLRRRNTERLLRLTCRIVEEKGHIVIVVHSNKRSLSANTFNNESDCGKATRVMGAL